MNDKRELTLNPEEENLNFLQRNLADLLTLSRVIIGLVILSLSLIGKNAYLSALILTLAGAATDMLDGKVARHYFGGKGEGKLGKHDVEIDIFFLLCVMGYLSISGIVIHRAIGLGWIGLVVIAIFITGKNMKIIVAAEIITVIGVLVIALLHSPLLFGVVIIPAGVCGLFINRRRVLYLIFNYWPSMFSKQ